MQEQANKLAATLKLFAVFSLGFLLWKCALLGLQLLCRRYGVDAMWTVVLSRLALAGYLAPFLLWLLLEPQKLCAFRFGDVHATIRMPFIWYGFKDNVLRVSAVFSLLCLVPAGAVFYGKQISVSVLWAGLAFAAINSVLEELLWRGLILSRTTRLCGDRLGLAVMSLAFGLYHYPLGFSIPVCLLFSLGGVYFGGIALRSKGLLLGTVMHISMNMLFVAIGIIF